MTAGYIAMPLKEPPCPFWPLPADSYIPLLMCWIYFFPIKHYCCLPCNKVWQS